MIEVRNLKFAYGKSEPVLRDVSFSLDRGESVCLLGPNGTGKTTLFKCMLGLQNPTGGNVSIDGMNLCSMSPGKIAKRIAYVPQVTSLSFSFSVFEIVLMGRTTHMKLGRSASSRDRDIAVRSLERLGIKKLINRKFNELSGGERQMVLTARALAQETDFLILDEPTSSLDYSNQIKVLQMITQLSSDGLGLMMISHAPDHAYRVSNRVLLLKDGFLSGNGSLGHTLTSEALSLLYDMPVAVSTAQAIFSGVTETVNVCIPRIQMRNH